MVGWSILAQMEHLNNHAQFWGKILSVLLNLLLQLPIFISLFIKFRVLEFSQELIMKILN